MNPPPGNNPVSGPQPGNIKDSEAKEKFIPKGAIAFFIVLVILSLLFWYGIYFLMIERT